MEQHNLNIQYTEYLSEAEMRAEDAQLLAEARRATGDAYAPYSGFKVGAAVLLENGEVITGNNQENAAYPSGLCAERVALFAASARFPGVPVIALAITARTDDYEISEPISPCGACRQVMAEYESLHKKPIRIIMAGESGKIMVLENVSGVLPFRFDGGMLKKK